MNHEYEYDAISEGDEHFSQMERDLDRIMAATPQVMRTAPTGATRDTLDGKKEYFKFFSVPVLHAYAEYMHKKRFQNDGTLRDSDNWQKGMPRDWYADSMGRHFMDIMLHHQGYPEMAEEDLRTALTALLFNVQAYLHEVLIGRSVKEND